MKTKSEKKLFETIVDKHNDGINDIRNMESSVLYDESKEMLNKLNKKALIRFSNYLLFYYPFLHIDITGGGDFDLFNVPK